MKITVVEPIHLRLPQVAEIADGTLDVLVVKIHTDAGLTGDRASAQPGLRAVHGAEVMDCWSSICADAESRGLWRLITISEKEPGRFYSRKR